MDYRTVRQFAVGWEKWLAYMEGTANVFIGTGPLAFMVKAGTAIIHGTEEIDQLIAALQQVRGQIQEAESERDIKY